MRQLIEFPLETGESIMFEEHIISQSGDENLFSQTINIKQAKETMESVLSAVGPIAATLVKNLKNSIGPDEIALELD